MSKKFFHKHEGQIKNEDRYIVINLDDFIRYESDLVGRLLTIIDSVIAPTVIEGTLGQIIRDQNKAVKDLIKQTIYDCQDEIWCTYLNKKDAESVEITDGGNP